MQLKRKAKRFKEKLSSLPVKIRPIKKGFGFEMPPEHIVVDIYFDQKGYPDQSGIFFNHFEQSNWCSPKGTPYRNWKLLASDWIFNYEQETKLRKRQRENMLAH